jgi:NCAIR mutase (PurE)-related protein
MRLDVEHSFLELRQRLALVATAGPESQFGSWFAGLLTIPVRGIQIAISIGHGPHGTLTEAANRQAGFREGPESQGAHASPLTEE